MNETRLILFPDPVLHLTSAEYAFDSNIQPLIDKMFATMYEHRGVGLSAIQIGIPLRLVVADVGQGKEVYVNPKIDRLGGTKKLMTEGCLSFPGMVENVMRFSKITISYQSPNGSHLALNTGGLRAQMLQHEIEHLDGKLLGGR